MFASQYVILLISFPKGYPFAVIATRTCTAVRVQLYMQLFNTKVSLFTVGPAYVYSTCTVVVDVLPKIGLRECYCIQLASYQLASQGTARATNKQSTCTRTRSQLASSKCTSGNRILYLALASRLVASYQLPSKVQRCTSQVASQLPSTKVPSSQQLPTFEGTFVLSYFRSQLLT